MMSFQALVFSERLDLNTIAINDADASSLKHVSFKTSIKGFQFYPGIVTFSVSPNNYQSTTHFWLDRLDFQF